MRLASQLAAAALLLAACDTNLNSVIGLAGSGSPFATHLVFTVQPSATAFNAPIAPPIQVAAQSATGNADTTYTSNVTLTIGTDPAAGSLLGTTVVTAVRGVATFNNVSINHAGNGYTLVATAPGVTSATSTAFNVTP